jgi:amidase
MTEKHPGDEHESVRLLPSWTSILLPCRTTWSLIKIVFWDGTGLCLFTKRLEHFIKPLGIRSPGICSCSGGAPGPTSGLRTSKPISRGPRPGRHQARRRPQAPSRHEATDRASHRTYLGNGIASLRPTPGLVSRSGMWDGYPSPTAQMGPMARTVSDLARLLDGLAGYDPEDPVTALGVGMIEGSYIKSLDRNGLAGARIGILRESIGVQSEPDSEDFKKVDAVFERNVAELKAAGAIISDPIVIPNLKALLSRRANNPDGFEAGLKIYLARNPDSNIKSRQDIANSPELAKSFPPTKADQWRRPAPELDPARYLDYLGAREELMFTVLKVMADQKLDAIVHKTVEHQPTFIKDGINPPYSSNKGVPTWNTFLVYPASITVPSGFTADNLPTGITFFGRPYSEPTLIRLAYAYEQATHHRRPPRTTPPLP